MASRGQLLRWEWAKQKKKARICCRILIKIAIQVFTSQTWTETINIMIDQVQKGNNTVRF